MRAKILLTVSVFILLFVTQANADFFDSSNGKWWLDESTWDIDASDNDYNVLSASDNDNQLQYTSVYRDEGGNDSADLMYVSKWAISLDNSFSLSVKYEVQSITAIDSDYKATGGLEFGITSSVSSWAYDYWINTKYSLYPDSYGYSDSESSYFSVSVHEPTAGDEADEYGRTERSSTTGTIGISYDAIADTLSFWAVEETESSDIIDLYTVSGLREKGVEGFYVYLDAYSRNALYSGVNVNYSQLKLVTPEPMSVILFGIGGSIAAFFRRKKV